MADKIVHNSNATTLGDILERVLDKGVVIAGDIKVNLADVELLNIKIRLVVCSVDKAVQLGINWWQTDPYLSAEAARRQVTSETEALKTKVEELQKQLAEKNKLM